MLARVDAQEKGRTMKRLWLGLILGGMLLNGACRTDQGAKKLTAEQSTTPRVSKVISVGTRPESVTRGFGGKYYVTVQNDQKIPGDGQIKVIDGDSVTTFAQGLDEPKGIVFTGTHLVCTDLKQVWEIDENGKKEVLANESKFPFPMAYLNDAALGADGKSVLVTEMGSRGNMRDPSGKLWPLASPQAEAITATGRVYRISLSDGHVTSVFGPSHVVLIPNGVTNHTAERMLVADMFNGSIVEVKDGDAVRILNSGFRGADGLEEDRNGTIYLGSFDQGKVWKFDKEGQNPRLFADGLKAAADMFLDEDKGIMLLPDTKAGTVLVIPLE